MTWLSNLKHEKHIPHESRTSLQTRASSWYSMCPKMLLSNLGELTCYIIIHAYPFNFKVARSLQMIHIYFVAAQIPVSRGHL